MKIFRSLLAASVLQTASFLVVTARHSDVSLLELGSSPMKILESLRPWGENKAITLVNNIESAIAEVNVLSDPVLKAVWLELYKLITLMYDQVKAVDDFFSVNITEDLKEAASGFAGSQLADATAKWKAAEEALERQADRVADVFSQQLLAASAASGKEERFQKYINLDNFITSLSIYFQIRKALPSLSHKQRYLKGMLLSGDGGVECALEATEQKLDDILMKVNLELKDLNKSARKCRDAALLPDAVVEFLDMVLETRFLR